MDIGRDNGLAVDRDYADRAPFAFTARSSRSSSTSTRILTEDDRAAVHEHAQHAALAHGIGA